MSIKPYSRPSINEADIQGVVEVLQSQYLTTGPLVPRLEEEFCKIFNAPYATACSNGTAALHLASLALDLGPGDCVIVPALTFLATANAVRMCGAEVVFCDVDQDSGMITLQSVQKAAETAKGPIKALYIVHMGGYGANLEELSAYARKQGWAVLEDACHGLGGSIQGHKVGSCHFSDLSTFSLHATKTFTSGEGGVIATRDPKIKARLDRLRNHGMSRNPNDFTLDIAYEASHEAVPWHYEMHELGYNYRLTDLQAALGVSQIRAHHEIRRKRATLAQIYHEELAPLAPVVQPVASQVEGEPLLHLFQVLIDFSKLSITRSELVQALMAQGVGTQVHYIPVHLQPYYQRRYGHQDLPGAQAFFQRVLALPFYTDLTGDEVRETVTILKSLLT